MSDIFISYRRNDNPDFTLRLRDRLRNEFGVTRVFFDQESIKPGDIFPNRIRLGIRAAKVVLVVMGEYWMMDKETRADRFKNSEDWVQQEVELALELARDPEGTKIIPILARIDNIPANLPASIELLRVHNAVKFAGGLIETDAQWDKLLTDLQLLLDGVAKPEPTLLPVLCDRDLQWQRIERQLDEQAQLRTSAPVVLVLPGRANEAHEAFVQRLEFDSIREWFQSNGWRGKAIFSRVREETAAHNFEEFAAWFRRLLARDAVRSFRIGSNSELLQAVERASVRLVVTVLQAHSSACMDVVRLSRMVADFWRQFPTTPPEVGFLTLICFKFSSTSNVSWWRGLVPGAAKVEQAQRRELNALAEELKADSRVRFQLLPELESPRYQHLDSWRLHPRVKQALRNRNLTDQRLRQVLNDQEALPMDNVIDGLNALLQEFSRF